MKEGGSRGRVRERLEEAVLLALNLRKGRQSKESKWTLEAGKVRKQISPQSLQEKYGPLTP